MKKIITLFFLLISLMIFSQEFKIEGVVNVEPTVTKEELYNRARTWVMKTYVSEKAVLSIQDKEAGELAGNATMNYKSTGMYFGVWCVAGTIDYKFSIYLKDGKYKYVFHSFVHKGSYYQGSAPINYGLLTTSETAPSPSRGSANQKAWQHIKQTAIQNTNETIMSLKRAMNQPYENNSDW